MIADAPSIPLTLTRTGARLFHFTQEMRGMELHRQGSGVLIANTTASHKGFLCFESNLWGVPEDAARNSTN